MQVLTQDLKILNKVPHDIGDSPYVEVELEIAGLLEFINLINKVFIC